MNAPAHLSDDARRWWDDVLAEYELSPSDLRLLQLAAEAWDRSQDARRALDADGLFFADRFGQRKTHPAVAVERDSRLAFARILRELALEVDGPEAPRPPILRRNGGR